MIIGVQAMERPAIKLGKLISIEYYMPVGMLSAIGLCTYVHMLGIDYWRGERGSPKVGSNYKPYQYTHIIPLDLLYPFKRVFMDEV